MSLLEKFINSLEIKLGKSYSLEVLKPFCFEGSMGRNIIIQSNSGTMYTGKEEIRLPEKSFYFVPEKQHFYTKLGNGSATDIGRDVLSNDEKRNVFLRNINNAEAEHLAKEKNKANTGIITVLSFEVTLYKAFPFFSLFQIPPFQLPYDEEFAYLLKHICLEDEEYKLGKDILTKNYMQELVVHICRYIESQPNLSAYSEKLSYLTNKRLVDVVHYIQQNLHKDLSNRAIANVAYVSEEYVGQFFKGLTNRTLQDYIESQRLEKAMQLLESHPGNVQEISQKVGFKDPAYFGKRFKLKFGINANAVKQGKALVV